MFVSALHISTVHFQQMSTNIWTESHIAYAASLPGVFRWPKPSRTPWITAWIAFLGRRMWMWPWRASGNPARSYWWIRWEVLGWEGEWGSQKCEWVFLLPWDLWAVNTSLKNPVFPTVCFSGVPLSDQQVFQIELLRFTSLSPCYYSLFGHCNETGEDSCDSLATKTC